MAEKYQAAFLLTILVLIKVASFYVLAIIDKMESFKNEWKLIKAKKDRISSLSIISVRNALSVGNKYYS